MKASETFPECPDGLRLLVQDSKFDEQCEFVSWLSRTFGKNKMEVAIIFRGHYDLVGPPGREEWQKKGGGFMAFIQEGTRR